MNRQVVSRQSAAVSPATLSARTPPKISRSLLRFFGRYAESYLVRHFHTVRLLRNSAPKTTAGLPLVIFLNHSSWWDPLVCLLLARRFFPRRQSYGAIDASALGRYKFFQRLGFFGVEIGSPTGARNFLQTARAILRTGESALWITPQGNFADFHTRPVQLQRGLSHLAKQVERVAFVPLAIQCVFWEERLPEILVGFGEQIVFDPGQALSHEDATRLFASALTSVQDHLANASARREGAEWKTIRRGRAGTNFFYDAWRKMRARLRGETFDAAHSKL